MQTSCEEDTLLCVGRGEESVRFYSTQKDKKGWGGVERKHDDLNSTRERYQSLCILGSLEGAS
jgi:hypothetical protein